MIVCVTASKVEITCALAWNSRCEVIRLTSSAIRSTLDDSSAPEEMIPKLEVPASPRNAVPDEKVS